MSSYNNFLSKIDVDEKELKRDLQNREKERNKGKVGNIKALGNSQSSNGTKPLKRIPTNDRTLGNKSTNKESIEPQKLNKNTSQQPTNRAQQSRQNDNSNNERRRVRNLSAQDNIIQRELVDNVSNNNRQAVNSRLPVKNKPNNESINRVRVEKVRRTPNLSKERLVTEKIHLRQKKVNEQLTRDKALIEKLTFNISKEEYDKKILGSIRQQQTKMIFLREGEKLAKVPKSVAFLGAYAFILSVVMLVAFSVVGNKKMELSTYNDKFNTLNEVNAQLNIKLATAYNIDNIRQRAEYELYMSKPETHQVMYITVVPENYVEYEMESDNE